MIIAIFDLEVFSLKNAYLRCIDEKLHNAPNNIVTLGTKYRGLKHFILAKHGGAENISRIKHQNCIKLPNTKTLFLVKKVGELNFVAQQITPTKSYTIKTNMVPTINNSSTINNPSQILKFLHKLLLQHISKIKHITLPNGTNLMLLKDFRNYYTTPRKLIKQALNIVEQLFCHPRCNPNCKYPCANHHSC